MKHASQFSDFLNDVVNLNDTRINQLDASVEAIKKFIRDSDWKPKLIEFAAHGSWAHQTIIKPVEGKAFDADLIAYIEPVENWEPKQYINELARIFRESNLYQEKLHVYSHCVTIEYAGSRKIDIAPCVVGRTSDQSLEVCNRFANCYQLSNPKEYTQWIKDKNSTAGNHSLRKVTRILKYMRDIKRNFTCPSFLLTTLVGLQIRPADKDSGDFADTPTALRTVMIRLDDWLAARLPVPQIQNPVLAGENQSEGWTETEYKNFRDKIHLYRQWIDDAYLEQDQEESIRKWRSVLGDEFGVLQESVRKGSASAESMELCGSLGAVADPVDLVRKFGAGAIGQDLIRPTHLKAPIWTLAPSRQDVRVSAELSFSSSKMKKSKLDDAQPLLPGHWVEFTASFANGAPLDGSYRTEWRVTNNGPVAERKGALRGGFYPSDNDHSRQEHLEYRGVHLVEAFVVRKADNVLVGQSKPFFVVIE